MLEHRRKNDTNHDRHGQALRLARIELASGECAVQTS
jgi:hypothetical protein